MSRRRLRIAAGVVWLLVLGILTLTPQPVTHSVPDLSQLSACVICGDRGTADTVLNLLLFVPLGVILADTGRGVLKALAMGVLLATCIELLQHFIPGRYSNLGDVLDNGMGAGVGALLWISRTRWLPGASRATTWLRNFAVLLVPVVVFGFGRLMRPAWPSEPYWGQWTPDLGFMEQYDGSVVHARLDSIPLPSHRIPAGRHPRDILAGDWDMQVTAVKGPAPGSLAPILNIYDGKHREVTMLGAVGEDLVYRERSWARVLRFDQPDLRVPGVMAHAAVGDTVRLSVHRVGPKRCLSFDVHRVCLGFTPGRAWSLLLYPEGAAPWVGRMLDALCILMLFFPVGLWSERRREIAVSGLLTALLMGLAVAFTRLIVPPWTEMAAGVAGLLLGHATRRLGTRP